MIKRSPVPKNLLWRTRCLIKIDPRIDSHQSLTPLHLMKKKDGKWMFLFSTKSLMSAPLLEGGTDRESPVLNFDSFSGPNMSNKRVRAEESASTSFSFPCTECPRALGFTPVFVEEEFC